MYATITDTTQIPDGAHRLEQVGTGTKAVLAFWETEQDAKEASDQVYEVEDSWTGPSVDDAPVTCVLLHFDGPVSQARRDAGKFAHEHRIKPILREHDGYVRGYTLVDPMQRSLVAVGMSNSFESAEAIGKAVSTSKLLPEEDPAMLQGCDRMELYRVE